jgi:hypothetical protein
MTDPDQDTKKGAQTRSPSPKPSLPKPKDKPKFGAPATKADHAAARRADKTVIKRMRKR